MRCVAASAIGAAVVVAAAAVAAAAVASVFQSPLSQPVASIDSRVVVARICQ